MTSQLSAAAARDWLLQTAEKASNAPLLLDVRENWEVAIASLPGAQHIPMGQLVGRFNEIDTTRSIIVFCHHGVRSLQVVAYLQRQGAADVHNLAGGIDAWSKTIDSQIALY